MFRGKFLLKGVLRLMSGNRQIMLMVLFWILEQLVESTETEVDDTAVELLKDMLGLTEAPDLTDLKKL